MGQKPRGDERDFAPSNHRASGGANRYLKYKEGHPPSRKRQTHREVGAQSQGSSKETAQLPKEDTMSPTLVVVDGVFDTDSSLENDVQKALDLHRHDNLLVAVLHIDVNVGALEYLHGSADTRAILHAINDRLDRAIRRSDTKAHVRFGQFVVVFPGMTTESDIQMVGEALYKALRKPFPVNGREIEISLHIGAATSATCHRRAIAILKNAALASYEAHIRHVPLHLSGSLFGSISRRLRGAQERTRRGEGGRWTGLRTEREQRAATA